VLAALIVLAPTADANATTIPWQSAPHPLLVHALRRDIRLHRGQARWNAYRLGIALRTGTPELTTVSLIRLRAINASWVLRRSRYRAALVRRAPVYAALMCIHSHESSWTGYSPAGPYYGGLQMSPTFELHYGSSYVETWGHAWNWPPSMQLAAAWRAVQSVGFTPWPASAMACGLL
jgi:hypothetical protein